MDDIARNQIKRIKMLQRELGMPDDHYRAMLATIEPVKSSKDLTRLGRAKAIRQLDKLKRQALGLPNNLADNPQMRMIAALLRDKGVGWNYLLSKGQKGTSFLQRLTGKQRIEWCTAQDLGKVIAALMYDQKRRAAG